MSEEQKKPTWAEIVEKSNGQLVFCPEDVLEEGKEFNKITKEFLAKAQEFEKIQQEYEVFAKNFWHNMRKAIEKKYGMSDVYGKTIGWNAAALKDEEYVINVVVGNQ